MERSWEERQVPPVESTGVCYWLFSKVSRTNCSSFQHSRQRAVTGCACSLSVLISGLNWNLSKHLPNKPGSSNTAATGAGLNRACQSPGWGMSQGASPGMFGELVQPSGQGRAAQLSTGTLKALLPTDPRYSIMELHLQLNPRALPSLAVMDSGNA